MKSKSFANRRSYHYLILIAIIFIGILAFYLSCKSKSPTEATSALNNQIAGQSTNNTTTSSSTTTTIKANNPPTNTTTLITLGGQDSGCCPDSPVTITYRIFRYGAGWTPWQSYFEPFHFSEECQHYLEVNVSDCLGNNRVDNETFFVWQDDLLILLCQLE